MHGPVQCGPDAVELNAPAHVPPPFPFGPLQPPPKNTCVFKSSICDAVEKSMRNVPPPLGGVVVVVGGKVVVGAAVVVVVAGAVFVGAVDVVEVVVDDVVGGSVEVVVEVVDGTVVDVVVGGTGGIPSPRPTRGVPVHEEGSEVDSMPSQLNVCNANTVTPFAAAIDAHVSPVLTIHSFGAGTGSAVTGRVAANPNPSTDATARQTAVTLLPRFTSSSAPHPQGCC
jgi:hypothetical protein